MYGPLSVNASVVYGWCCWWFPFSVYVEWKLPSTLLVFSASAFWVFFRPIHSVGFFHSQLFGQWWLAVIYMDIFSILGVVRHFFLLSVKLWGNKHFHIYLYPGGSVRLPAAWCGICALKPTSARLSRLHLTSDTGTTTAGNPGKFPFRVFYNWYQIYYANIDL